MGAHMDQVEAYLVFTSKEQMEQAFSSFKDDEDYKSLDGMFNWVNLNDTYFFVNDPNGYPYSVITLMDGYFSELTSKAYWGQFFLHSESMNIDEAYTKPLVNGLQLVEPHSDYENISGFSEYFQPVTGLKKFTGDKGSFRIHTGIKEINGTSYFYYDNQDQSEYFPWVMEDILLCTEQNKIYGITCNGAAPNDFNKGSYMKEMFANTCEEFHGCSFILSEESGFRLNKYMGIVPDVSLNGTYMGECLVFMHDYVHVNCYSYNASHQFPFEHYVCKDVVFYTYWQKGNGLAGIACEKENTRWEFTGSLIAEVDAPKDPGELKSSDRLQDPAKKKGWLGKLFSGK